MEINALRWVHETFHSQAWLNYIMEAITYLGEFGLSVIVCAIVLFAITKTRKAGFDMACGILINILIVNVILKFAVNRARPWTEAEEFKEFYSQFGIRQPTDSSFPSGHSAIMFCGAVSLLFSYKVKALPALGVAILVALSRIYLCLHYPTDVLGGVLIGSACGVAGHFVAKYLYPFVEKLLSLIAKKFKKSAPAEQPTAETQESVEGDEPQKSAPEQPTEEAQNTSPEQESETK